MKQIRKAIPMQTIISELNDDIFYLERQLEVAREETDAVIRSLNLVQTEGNA